MKRAAYLLVGFVPGVLVGAELAYRAYRINLEAAKFSAKLEGALDAFRAHDAAMNDLGYEHAPRRRRWFS